MFNSILVPTDGSKLSQKAVEQAVLLAKVTGAKLVALHVYSKFPGNPYATYGPTADFFAEAYVRQHETDAEEIFAGIKGLASAAGVALDTVLVESDDIYAQIIAVAKRKRCDLICMASHGRRGLAGVVLGSETNKVLTHSTIPVLVMR
jgi:nucleotide-binding universal stress UspA family protein